MEAKKVKIVEVHRTGHTWSYHILNEDNEVIAKFNSVIDEGPWAEDIAKILSQLGYTVEIKDAT